MNFAIVDHDDDFANQLRSSLMNKITSLIPPKEANYNLKSFPSIYGKMQRHKFEHLLRNSKLLE